MRLCRFETKWAAVVGRALLPEGLLGGVVDDVDIGARFAEDLRCSPWEAALMSRLALWLVWLAPLWRRGRWRSFAGLPLEERVALLEELLDSPHYLVRSALLFLKLAFSTVLLGDERVLARLGAYRPRVLPASEAQAAPLEPR